eukprot:7641409-Pyramimonas_sp.AAC.2
MIIPLERYRGLRRKALIVCSLPQHTLVFVSAYVYRASRPFRRRPRWTGMGVSTAAARVDPVRRCHQRARMERLKR